MRGPCECECECECEYLTSVQIGCASDVSHLSYKLELKTTANFGPPTRPRAASRPSSLSYYRPLSRLDSPHIAPPRTSQRRVELYQRNHVPRQRPQHYRHRYRCRSGILERLVRVTSFSLPPTHARSKRRVTETAATFAARATSPFLSPPPCQRRRRTRRASRKEASALATAARPSQQLAGLAPLRAGAPQRPSWPPSF